MVETKSDLFQGMHTAFKELQNNTQNMATTTAKERMELLNNFLRVFELKKEEIEAAVYRDYKRSVLETELSEFWLVKKELNFAIRHLEDWVRPKRVPTPLVFFGSSSFIHYEAKGTVLIISPWNFPFNLTFSPLISAIAAGNTVMIKPSEFTSHSSHLIKQIVEEAFPENIVTVCEGGADVSKELLTFPFNHIFFTGSTRVGKLVMKAAAENLTSVTLELGGKTPVIIDETADLKMAAQKTVYAKFLNNGQVCLASDYVFVQENVAAEFKMHLLNELEKMYPEENLLLNKDYARLVNDQQLTKVSELIEDAIEKGGKLLKSRQIEEDNRFIAPTLIENISSDMRIAQEEIFGPILPIKSYTNLEQVIDHIHQGSKPLAVYLFSKNKKNVNHVLANVSAGATLVNEVYIHHYNSYLPFGGVNHSGIGKSHGHFGFLEFTNQKAVVKQWLPFSATKLIQPPYSASKKRLAKLIVKFFS